MILKAKHHFILYPFFKSYSVFILKKNFNAIYIYGEFNDKNLPVLVIANHVSWWDGFWIEFLNRKVFNRNFYFMMLEEQLRKYWFFNYIGGYSVNKKSKSVIETIQYTAELLTNNKNLVLIFPQGEIQSLYSQTFKFEKGLDRIIKSNENKIHIIFAVNMVDYFSKPKPGLYIYYTEYIGAADNTEIIQEKYTDFYKLCVEKQMRINV
jgi:1-acyl-sn-glycerol-3-phosphate acyltransferase